MRGMAASLRVRVEFRSVASERRLRRKRLPTRKLRPDVTARRRRESIWATPHVPRLRAPRGGLLPSSRYTSAESGRNEIYVRPYPGPGGEIKISSDGGIEPAWSPDGREIFYRSSDSFMAVPLRVYS